jgi:hypothetical protein
MNRRNFITYLAAGLAALGITKSVEAAVEDNPWAFFKEIDPILESRGIRVSSRAIDQLFVGDGWENKDKQKIKTKAVYQYKWHVTVKNEGDYCPVFELNRHHSGDNPWWVRSLSTNPQHKYHLTLDEAIAELHRRGRVWTKAPPSSGYGDTWEVEYERS